MLMLHVVLPLALLIASGAVAAFAWAVRSGQLDDVDSPPRRILVDDDGTPAPAPPTPRPGGPRG